MVNGEKHQIVPLITGAMCWVTSLLHLHCFVFVGVLCRGDSLPLLKWVINPLSLCGVVWGI